MTTPNTPPPGGQQPSGGAGIPPQDIFAILGLQDLPDSEKQLLLGKLERVIQEQVIHLIVTQLTDEQCQDLNEKMDQGLQQMEVIDYLRGTIPDLDQQIRNLVENFKEDLLVEVDDIRKELASGKTPSPHPVSKRFSQGYTEPQQPAPAHPSHPHPHQHSHPHQQQTLPPEVQQQLTALNQAIDQATEAKNYEGLVQLMHQRKQLKAQWGLPE